MKKKKYVDENKLSSISLYVKKIENIPKNFIFGMDISSLISEEESGVKYYNFKDEEKDLLEIIKNVGINYIRIRIWNDPYDSEGHGYGGGNCDMEKAIKIRKRATMYGMKVMASFHFSDFYADPKLQKVPKAWANLTFEQKAIKAKEFIIESINRFKEEGINLGIATFGNEITNGFCGETDWTKIVEILNPCSKAAREIFPDILIAVHFTNPEKEGFQKWLAQELNNNNLDYDIFSTSYYGFWHGTLENLKNTLNFIAETYNKKVLIAETSYPYSRDNFDLFPNTNPSYDDTLFYPLTVQGQANHLYNLIKTMTETKNSLGVFYWEPAWIPVKASNYEEYSYKWETYGSGWSSSYAQSYDSEHYSAGGCVMDNQALFNPEGKPLESLKVYNLIKFGNEITPEEDGVEDISVNPIDFTTFSLPQTIKVILSNEQRIIKNVNWDDNYDINKAQNSDNQAPTYEYNGKAGNIDIKCIFQNNSSNKARKFVFSYYIGSKYLSPWRLNSMIRIRDL